MERLIFSKPNGDVPSRWDILEKQEGNFADSEISLAEKRTREKSGFSEKEVEVYFKDRFEQNLKLLRKRDRNLAVIYKDIIEQYPELSNVEIAEFKNNLIEKDEEDTAFTRLKKVGGRFRPQVRYNFKHEDVYFFEPEKASERKTRFETAQVVSLNFGVDPKEAIKNKTFMTSFAFLHEFGHALDFQKNYIEKNPGDLFSANRKARSDRAYARTALPYHGKMFEETLSRSEKRRRREKRLRDHGIYANKWISSAKNRAYRKMPSEKVADDFVTEYMRSHFDYFFTTERKDNDERLPVKIGEQIELDENFAFILGIGEGNQIKLKNRGKDLAEGFLCRTPEIGKKLELRQSDNPFDEETSLETEGIIKRAFVVPKVKNGKLDNHVYIDMDDGMRFGIDKTKEESVETGESEDALIALNKNLGLNRGSEIQVLKRSPGKDDAETPRCIHPVLGYLGSNGFKPITPFLTESGEKISLDIRRVFRKWKTYFIETSSGTYEIMPL